MNKIKLSSIISSVGVILLTCSMALSLSESDTDSLEDEPPFGLTQRRAPERRTLTPYKVVGLKGGAISAAEIIRQAGVKRPSQDDSESLLSDEESGRHGRNKFARQEVEEEDSEEELGEAEGIESSFSSPFKRLISRYIPQVVKIEFSSEDGGHSGTGFIFNAERGIILTNHHVVGTKPGYYKVILQDGEEYSEEDVKVIGISPNRAFGDFAFLKVDRLIAKFPQMPLAREHTVKKHDPIAFMGNSEGSFCVEEGNVNVLFDFLGQPEVASFRVQLSSRGGASGSPTYNIEGKINGILWGGSGLEHTSVIPIHWPLAAYEMMMGPRGIIRPISFTSLGSKFQKQSIYDIHKYYGASRSFLGEFLPKEFPEVRELLVCSGNGFKADEGYNSLQDGDILLAVEGTPIGCDTIKLHRIIDGKESVRIKVLGIDERVKDLRVKPRVLTQKYPRSIELDCGSIVEGTAEVIEHRFNDGDAIFFPPTAPGILGALSEEKLYKVAGICGRATPTFVEFTRVLHQVYMVDKRTAFILSLEDSSGKITESQEVDLSTFLGKPLNVTSMIEGHWRSQSLGEFLADA